MTQSTIEAVLNDAMPAECQLRPDIAAAASHAAAEETALQVRNTVYGDPADMPDLIDLMYKSALFVAIVVRIIKDVKSIADDDIDRRARTRDPRTNNLPEKHRRLLIERTRGRIP